MNKLIIDKFINFRNFSYILIIFISICVCNSAWAKVGDGGEWGQMKDGGLPVTIYASKLDHQNTRNLIIGTGYVDIRYGSMRLQADSVELNTVTGQAVAMGNAVLDEGGNRITGDKMDVNINTGLGTIYNGEGALESGYFFKGRKIERVAEDEFIIYDGSYTTCSQPIPDWSLNAEKNRLHIENYAYLSNFTMRVNDVPFLYSPYGVVPIKTKRSSGFLFPQFGQSNQDGFFLKNSYFWAINDWSDATFGVDYYSKRGIGKDIEGRYSLTGKDWGKLNAYHIDDDLEKRDRWKLLMDARQEFPNGINTKLHLDKLSDIDFERQFATTAAQRNRQEQESYLAFTKNWENYNLNLWVDEFRDLYQTQKTVSQKAPELNFNSTSHRLYKSPFFLEWESSFAALEKRVDDKITLRTQRANFYPRLSLPIKLREGMVFTPSVGNRTTWYSNKPVGGGGITRNIYDIRLAFDGPQVYRTFDVNGYDGLSKLKHVIFPNITYTYVPYQDQSELYDFGDGVDRIGQAYRLDYSIINHLLGKFDRPGVDPEIRDILTVTLSQGFDLAEERRMVNVNTSPRRPLTPLKVDVEIKPDPSYRFDIETYYDVYEHYNERTNMDLWITPTGRPWSLNAGWRSQKDTKAHPERLDFFNGGGKIRLGRWEYSANITENLKEMSRVEGLYRIVYYSQCWSIAFNYVTRPDEEEISFMINLTGLGSVGK